MSDDRATAIRARASSTEGYLLASLQAASDATFLLDALAQLRAERDALAERSDGLYAAFMLMQANRDTLREALRKIAQERAAGAMRCITLQRIARVALASVPEQAASE